LKRHKGNAEAVFSPLRHTPAYKALSAAIERKILERELRPGDMLPPEQQLAEQFRVNRSTVREAIRQLEQEGLVVRGAGRRLHVAVPGVHELAPRTTRALLLQQVTFTQLWEVAMMLEPQAAAMAAHRRTAEDLVRLETNVEATAHAVARGDSFTELDIDFHAGIALASHNWVLILAREPVNLLFRPTMDHLRTAMPQAAVRNLEAHRRILAAIRSSNQDSAQVWARKHLTDFQRGYRIAELDMDDVVQWDAA
jgi:GntR family transcriptional regulator, transcriptional repressor for pyruvate dehydrogenase complex